MSDFDVIVVGCGGPQHFPVFIWHGAHNFYCLPVYGEVATKLGQHLGGH